MNANPNDPLREALEAALVSNPDDRATHMAYADHLTTHGDPRGAFIQVQLALEQASDAERGPLLERERALLAEHRDTFLGPLAEPFAQGNVSCHFRRGWLDALEIPTLRADLATALAGAPQIRLLRRLAVVSPDARRLDPAQAFCMHVLAGTAWFEEEEEAALVPLLDCPYLGNVRVFQLGAPDRERCDVGDGPVADLLDRMPHLEELRLFLWRLEDGERIAAMPFPHLRVLHLGGVYDYPLETLAANNSLENLHALLLQPAAPDGHIKLDPSATVQLIRSRHLPALRHLSLSFLMVGDPVCEALVDSGFLNHLQTLDLQYSEITDQGAEILAGAAGLGRLERLDVVGNRLTDAGIDRLRATGVNLVHAPQAPEEEGEDDLDEEEEWDKEPEE